MSEQTPKEDVDEHYLARKLQTERNRVATLTARCEALESERNEARMAATELLTAVGLAKDGLAIERVRCEALEQDRKDFRDEVHTLAKACTDTALERDALKVRCEALTAERDRQAAEIEAWKLDYAIAVASRDAEIARLGGKPGEVGGGTGEGDAPDRPDRQTYMQADSTTVDALRSRCQHLEQAVKETIGRWNELAGQMSAFSPQRTTLKNCSYALASLLPAQEETPRTDENRVSFAAGYSQALDDQAKGLK